MASTVRFLGLVSLLLALLLAGCPKPAPTGSATAGSATAGSAQPQPQPPPTVIRPTAAPVTPSPAGWVEHDTDALAIRLPVDWEVIDFNAGDLQTIFSDLQKRDPDLARIIGSPEALQDAAFWAFRGVNAATVFADNLNIRRSSLSDQRIETMQSVMDPVVAQYRTLGFQVLAADANLTIGERPAAHIVFSFEINAAEVQPTSVQGHQYLVATDADLWILSYSASAETVAELAPVFQQSALSFRVK